MYRLSVVSEPSAGVVTKVWLRSPDGERYHQLELAILRDLKGSDLVPLLVDAGQEPTTVWVKIEAHTPLSEWLRSHGSPPERSDMRVAIRDQLHRLHAAGICHRDVHLGNVVIDAAGTPRFIDFELATRVDPNGPCFDILGPQSGVPVPEEHRRVGLAEGVWWNQWPPALGSAALARTFGPLTS